MIEIATRERTQPAPPAVVFGSLTDPSNPSARTWLELRDDEVQPVVLAAVEPGLVVWSSFWPSRPDDFIRFELRPAGSGTALRWTWVTDTDPPAERTSSDLRFRMNSLINRDLRLSYGQ